MSDGARPRFDHHDGTVLGDGLYAIYAGLRKEQICRSDAHGGFWGIHRCVGAQLAQADLRTLADALLSKGTLMPAGQPEPSPLEGGHHLGWCALPLNLAWTKHTGGME